MPLEVTAGDQVLLPVVFVNNTEDNLKVSSPITAAGPLKLSRWVFIIHFNALYLNNC